MQSFLDGERNGHQQPELFPLDPFAELQCLLAGALRLLAGGQDVEVLVRVGERQVRVVSEDADADAGQASRPGPSPRPWPHEPAVLAVLRASAHQLTQEEILDALRRKHEIDVSLRTLSRQLGRMEAAGHIIHEPRRGYSIPRQE